jgi:predicted metal-dependent enzyme (double-stranded beta helix superfamily)
MLGWRPGSGFDYGAWSWTSVTLFPPYVTPAGHTWDMFAIDELVGDCQAALTEEHPQLAVRDVLKRVLDRPGEVADAFGAREGGLNLVHVSPELTVLHVTWAPGMQLYPHNHEMWAVIGIYGGQEDNTFYRRDGRALQESGGKALKERDVLVLGDDVIHAVANPLDRLTGAIHVYGGDFVSQPRSQWPPEAGYQEEPYSMDRVTEQFAQANEAWHNREG